MPNFMFKKRMLQGFFEMNTVPANENLAWIEGAGAAVLPPNIQTGAILQVVRPPPSVPRVVDIPGIPAGDVRLQVSHQAIGRHDPGTIRRMEMPDLLQLEDWLTHRLHERHTQAASAEIKGFLRVCLSSNEWWFVRTEQACGMARLVRLPLEPQPVVQDFFVFMRMTDENDIDAMDQAASLYPAMASWAAHQNASRLIVPQISDVPLHMIRSRMQQTPHSTGSKYVELGRVY